MGFPVCFVMHQFRVWPEIKNTAFSAISARKNNPFTLLYFQIESKKYFS